MATMRGKTTLLAILLGMVSAAPLPTPATRQESAIEPPLGHTKMLISEAPSFQVTNFHAGAVVLSRRNYYNFNLQIQATPSESTTLYCQLLGTTFNESLGTTPETWCTESDPTGSNPEVPSTNNLNTPTPTGQVFFQWKLVSEEEGAELVIVRQVEPSASLAKGEGDDGGPDEEDNGAKVTDEGVYYIPIDQIPVLGEGRFSHQEYVGPENFSVNAFRFLTV